MRPLPLQIGASYGDKSYWEDRYKNEPTCFDWYQGYPRLKSLLLRYVPQNEPVLQVGVGTSRLQEDMVLHGSYQHITNVDISSTAIAIMSATHQHLKQQLEYRVGDAAHMPEFADAAFGSVIDKGTLDALACGQAGAVSSAGMMRECFRVLRPGGVFMMITYGGPASRLPYLVQPGLAWSVDVYVIAKAIAAAAAPGVAVVAVASPDASDPCTAGPDPVSGPFSATGATQMAALCELQNVHFVYVCTKSSALATGNAAEAAQEAHVSNGS